MDIPTERDVLTHALLSTLYDEGGDFEPVDPVALLSHALPARTELDDWVLDEIDVGDLEREDGTYGVLVSDLAVDRITAARRVVNDRGFRRHLTRDRLLHWVDLHSARVDDPAVALGDFAGSLHAWISGARVNQANAEEAAVFLEQVGLLLRSAADPSRVGITTTGQDCVSGWDSRVDPYLDAIKIRQSDPVPAVPTESLDRERVAVLARAVRQALPVLGLDEGAERHLRDLEQSDDTRVRLALQWFGRLTDGRSAGALGVVLGLVAVDLLRS